MTDLAAAPPLPGPDEPPADHLEDADPAVAARLGLVPAPPGVRSLAFAIDAVIYAALASPAVAGALILRAEGAAGILPVVLVAAGAGAATLFGLIQLIVHGRRGVTTGKAAMRLRSVAVDGFGRPGVRRVLLRALVLWVSGVVPVAGPTVLLASGLWDPERRGRSILDRVGRCWLIDARAGLDPFDAKALRHARRALRPRRDDLDEKLPSMASGIGVEDGLRIPDDRSRSGVVGPGGTGARWSLAHAVPEPALIDGVPGVSPADAAVPAAAAAPPAQTAQTAQTAPAAPAAPAPAPDVAFPAGAAAPAAATRRAQQVVRFDDGSLVRVPVFGLLGRDPEAVPGENVDALVRLEDPERLMSKTHAAFGQDADGVWVRDRASRNGTLLEGPEGESIDVPADQAMRAPAGWTVRVGGRSFTVIARGADS